MLSERLNVSPEKRCGWHQHIVDIETPGNELNHMMTNCRERRKIIW